MNNFIEEYNMNIMYLYCWFNFIYLIQNYTILVPFPPSKLRNWKKYIHTKFGIPMISYLKHVPIFCVLQYIFQKYCGLFIRSRKFTLLCNEFPKTIFDLKIFGIFLWNIFIKWFYKLCYVPLLEKITLAPPI